jgi:hypothetical protein
MPIIASLFDHSSRADRRHICSTFVSGCWPCHARPKRIRSKEFYSRFVHSRLVTGLFPVLIGLRYAQVDFQYPFDTGLSLFNGMTHYSLAALRGSNTLPIGVRVERHDLKRGIETEPV